MKHATIEIKERAVYLFLFKGYTYINLEKIFNYSTHIIKKWVAAYKKGELWKTKERGRPPSRLDENDLQFLKEQITTTNHSTVRGLTKLLEGKCGKSTVHAALRKMGFTFKKNSSRR